MKTVTFYHSLDGVHRIPTLVYEDQKLSGFFLTKTRIRRFLEELQEGHFVRLACAPDRPVGLFAR